MAKTGQGTYSAIFRTKAAYRFDVGTLLMRLFSYTTTIGTITTLTLAGASALEASSASSLIAVCMFFVAPRVSRRIDERGQSAVVPKAAAIAMAGMALMLSSTGTEPQPKPQAADAPKGGSVLATTPVVRVLFGIMVLFGAVYGAFDTAAISYTESIDMAMLASAVFAVESVFSVVMSFAFGLVRISAPMRRQVVMFAVLFGCLYGLFAFVNSPASLIVIACISALSYSPLYITVNLACERAVENERLTEALSWIVSGMSIGMVIGPVTSGAIIDAFSPLAGFDLAAGFALCVIALALCSVPVLRKHL